MICSAASSTRPRTGRRSSSTARPTRRQSNTRRHPPPPRRRPRARAAAAAARAAAVALDDDDSDLEILDAPPEAAKGPEQVLHDDVDGDGDLVVVGSSGLVASNMPHPRHACTTHRFRESKARRTVAENARRCDHLLVLRLRGARRRVPAVVVERRAEAGALQRLPEGGLLGRREGGARLRRRSSKGSNSVTLRNLDYP